MNQAKLYDALVAGALGDAFGYAIEFDSWSAIQESYGPQGLAFWPLNEAGALVASDDTQMTLFALEALRSARQAHGAEFDLAALEASSVASFLRWLESQGRLSKPEKTGLLSHGCMWRRRAPGNTCLSALSSLKNGMAAVNDSKGCGAAMRAAPYAILAADWGLEGVWRAASQQGALTHKHADGHLSGAAMAYLLASEPANKRELLLCAGRAAELAQAEGGEGTAKALRAAAALADQALDPESLCDRIGEGWTGDEAVGVAVWAAARADDVTSAIMLGANHRGDSDSTASLAGQLASCLFGLTPAERAMFEKVDLAEPLREEWSILCAVWPDVKLPNAKFP